MLCGHVEHFTKKTHKKIINFFVEKLLVKNFEKIKIKFNVQKM